MMDQYPHEYSGGMRQRAVIAMALSCSPDIIIADEPTTALDVIVQDSLLREMIELQEKLNMSMIYISHDIAVIAEVTERIGVMYAGRMAEFGTAVEIFKHPLHPYSLWIDVRFSEHSWTKTRINNFTRRTAGFDFSAVRLPVSPALSLCNRDMFAGSPGIKDMGGQHFASCWHPLEGN